MIGGLLTFRPEIECLRTDDALDCIDRKAEFRSIHMMTNGSISALVDTRKGSFITNTKMRMYIHENAYIRSRNTKDKSLNIYIRIFRNSMRTISHFEWDLFSIWISFSQSALSIFLADFRHNFERRSTDPIIRRRKLDTSALRRSPLHQRRKYMESLPRK